MESNTNASRISILFGEEPQGKEQISIQLQALFGSAESLKQKEKLQLLGFTSSDLDYSLVLSLKPAPGQHDSLYEHIKSMFDGQVGSRMSKDLNEGVKSGFISYNLLSHEGKIYLLIKSGHASLEELENQIKALKDLGLAPVIEGQQNKVTLEISSTQSFPEIEAFVKSGKYTFVAALLRTLKLDLNFILNSKLVPLVVDTLSNLDPSIANSPIGFLSFFKNLDLDLRFSSVDELPDYFKNQLLKHPDLTDGLSVSPNLPEPDQKSFIKLQELVDDGIEVFVTVKELAGLHLKVTGPGFGQHMVSRISKNLA